MMDSRPFPPVRVWVNDCDPLGITLRNDDLLGEILTVPVARIGALLPLLMMVLILLFRPRGLMGTRDT